MVCDFTEAKSVGVAGQVAIKAWWTVDTRHLIVHTASARTTFLPPRTRYSLPLPLSLFFAALALSFV